MLKEEIELMPVSQVNSGAKYLYRKEKETRELIFPWLSWLSRYCLWVRTHDDGLIGPTETCSLGLYM